MLILEAKDIEKFYGDRLIVKFDALRLYKGDRIGIVGLNGCGKTTLMNILTKNLEPDKGNVKLYSEYSYIKQQEENTALRASGSGMPDFREFNVEGIDISHASGGEKTRLKIAQSLSKNRMLMFADEPTCNLDISGARLLEEKLKAFEGTLVLISHDRVLMDNICSRILEVENGNVKVYEGNYTAYRNQKKAEQERQAFLYGQYIKEKGKLGDAMDGLKRRVKTMRKAPARMGNSEARLHTREANGKKARLDRSVKAMESRINRLEVRKKPEELPRTRIDIQNGSSIVSKLAISAANISKSFGSRNLFGNVSFEIPKGRKVALVGDNGTGKTTLIKMLLEGAEGVKIAHGSHIGYFSQDCDILDSSCTILENVMEVSVYPESFVRTVLARLLFKREDVFKKIGLLSGGERVKIAFAKIFVQDFNILIMDEPTNYLDVYSMEALEDVLDEYPGTMLFVSHDRRFIEKIADSALVLENEGVKKLALEQYFDSGRTVNKVKQERGQKTVLEKIMLLENKLADISGRLSMPSKKEKVEALNIEYMDVLRELKSLRESVEAAR